MLSRVVTDCGYLCAAGLSEVVLLLLRQYKGLQLLLKGEMALFYLPFLSLCCLDIALPADCCAHLFPDPKGHSQLFSTGCILCLTGSQRGLRARARAK